MESGYSPFRRRLLKVACGLSASVSVSTPTSPSSSHMQDHWSTLSFPDQKCVFQPLSQRSPWASESPKGPKKLSWFQNRTVSFTPTVRFCSFGVCIRICFWYILESCWVPQGSHRDQWHTSLSKGEEPRTIWVLRLIFKKFVLRQGSVRPGWLQPCCIFKDDYEFPTLLTLREVERLT